MIWPLLALTALTFGVAFFLGRWAERSEREAASDWPCCLKALEHLSESHRRPSRG